MERYSHDLLPMPYTFEAARITARKIREARDFLEVPIAVENVSSYAEFHVSQMTEWEFLNEVVEQADCGILLDVNNIYVSSQNHDFDPLEYLNSVPAGRVAQIHIAGHSKFEKYILDTHDHPVIDPVWKLYDHAIRRVGPTATLLEWDDRVPLFDEVHQEARKAGKFLPQYEEALRLKLIELQRRMAADLMRPLTRHENLSRNAKAADYVAPNGRLTSHERLQIYSRSYWYRILDSLYDDFPGLRYHHRRRSFSQVVARLSGCASVAVLHDVQSGFRAGAMVAAGAAITPAASTALALDMVRLEWAHIQAFDGPSAKPLGPEDLLELGPELRMALQPYISLLEVHYPVDDLASGQLAAVDDTQQRSTARMRDQRKTEPMPIIVVHRFDNSVYYRRIQPEEFRILTAIRRGDCIANAIEAGCDRKPAVN